MSRFLLIELLALVFPLTLATCPKGAIEGLNPSDCYIFIAAPKNWNDAESDCVSRQGHLASIPDAFHNAFLKQEISLISSSVNETWIGANTIQTPDQWTWSDQTNFTYSNFLQGMTENDTNVCASFDTYTGKWSVESCHDLSLSYICKVNAESGTNSCDAGYVYFPGTKYCYKTIDASGKNFNQTEDECARDGGHLTSIHNEDENTFVLALIYGSNAWIGLYFDGLIGNWTDGTPNDYNNFFASPSIFDKCAYLVGQHGIPDLYRFWVTDDCTKSEGLAVCKKSSA